MSGPSFGERMTLGQRITARQSDAWTATSQAACSARSSATCAPATAPSGPWATTWRAPARPGRSCRNAVSSRRTHPAPTLKSRYCDDPSVTPVSRYVTSESSPPDRPTGLVVGLGRFLDVCQRPDFEDMATTDAPAVLG